MFLPLLGGYLFYTRWHVTSFYAARCGNQRLLLNAAAGGLVLLIIARALVLYTDWLSIRQAVAVLWTSYLYIASVGVLVLALGWVYYESRGDEALQHELGQHKRAAGLLIAGIAIFSALTIALQLEGDPVRSVLVATICFSVLSLVTLALARLLRSGMSDLEEHLQSQFRPRALLFRISLLMMILLHASLLLSVEADQVDSIWKRFSPYIDSGTPFLACMLGAFAPFALNLLVPYQIANARLHHNHRTNSLERLLYHAAVDASLVQVTLKDGKVYVGWIDRLPPDPASTDAYLQLLPVTSGYRDTDTKQVTYTTHYDEILAEEHVDIHDFLKVLPISDIASAGKFREDVYLMFAKSGQRASASEVLNPVMDDDPLPPALR